MFLVSIFSKKTEMEFSFEERASLCALNRVFGFEPRIGAALVDAAGGAAEVFRMDKKDLEDVLGPYSRERYLPQINEAAFDSAAMELEALEEEGSIFICLGEDGYPALLSECEDPPLGLYYKGVSPPEEVFSGRPDISIIGTRSPTSYGKEWCQRIVSVMSKASIRPLVVSGLALGVDVTAHKAALECGLPTVAVMATGIDDIYPTQNQFVGDRIASTPGCALVTDYPPKTSPIRVNFLRRNRIIAGISRATVLVESKIKGGGMMTARLASSYGRDVYALPGRLDDPDSQGCNLLVRENIAEPIGDLAEFLARLGLGKASVRLKVDFMSEVEAYFSATMEGSGLKDVLKAASFIKGHRGCSMDDICRKYRWNYQKVVDITSMLECEGFIGIDLLQHCFATPRRF